MEQSVTDSVEASVGISVFLSPGEPIKCLFKQRFSDFVVNEVTPERELVFLSDPHLWKDFSSVKESHQAFMNSAKEAEENPFHAFDLAPTFVEEATALLGEDVTQKIVSLVELLKTNPHMRHFEVRVPLPVSKDDRLRVHNFVREQLPFLDSQTLNSNNTKRVQKNDKFQKKKQQPTEPIPEELQNCILIKVSPINFKRYKTQAFRKDDQQVGKYVHFTLMKRNLDSINAGILISKFVGISNKHFAMAGIKDKRGITTQRASLQGITIEQLEEIQSRKNWNKNIVISDYKYSNTSLALGDLYGNRFAVSLRMVGPATVERKWEIARNIEHLKLHGFINYFGLQRFGVNREIKTHDIGRYVIRQQWKDVVNAMLKSACTSDPHTRQAIEQYFAEEPLNHRKLLRSLPMKLRLERMLLQALETFGTNFLSAFMTLPRNAREIYAHAYQSYLWNKMASLRVRVYGPQVLVGDLVMRQDHVEEMVQEAEVEEVEEVEDGDDQIVVPEQHEDIRPILVTAENQHEFTFNDVVLPIYGRQTELPPQSIASQLFDQVLLQENIMREDFANLPTQFILKGGYRKLICVPEDFEHEIVHYVQKDQDLLSPFYRENPSHDTEGGPYCGLIVKFTLKKSAYATMLIRELSKSSSSLEHQQKISLEYV